MPEKRSSRFNRRDLIAVGLGLAGSLAISQPASAQSPEAGYAALLDITRALPPSPIQTGIQNKVLPIFSPNKPAFIELAGIKMPLRGSTIKIGQNQNIPNWAAGGINIRKMSASTPSTFYSKADTEIRLPFLGLLREQEKTSVPAENRAPVDDTPYVSVFFPQKSPINVGLEPSLTAEVNPTLSPEPLLSLAYVTAKELCTTYLILLWIEDVIRNMKRLCFSTGILEQSPAAQSVEVVTSAVSALHNHQGRFPAAYDIAGSFLVMKATEGTALEQHALSDPIFRQAITSVRGYQRGDTESELLYNSLQWAINAPEAASVPHNGDLEKKPLFPRLIIGN